MTELILIRHGETIWNSQSRCQGHLDSDLTALGLQQAEAIADRLSRVRFDALYSSDLGRAWKTAERIASKTGHEVVADVDLRERGLGIFQGLTIEQIRQQHPAEHARFAARDPAYVIPGGESPQQKHERAVRCLEALAGRHAEQRIVAVTHGGILDSMYRHAVGLSLLQPRRWVLYNASLNVFQFSDNVWRLATWGDVSHLRQAGTLDDF